MPADNIYRSGKQVDMGTRIVSSSAVVASPATGAEVVVCSITGITSDLPVVAGVFLTGGASYTIGTSGTSTRVRIRTGTTAGSGTVIADSNTLTGGIAATNLISQDLQGFDTTSTGGAAPATTSYCLTVQVSGAAAASTVTQTNLTAIIF